MIAREYHLENLNGLLEQFPVVALIGARQVGKTTLARMFVQQLDSDVHYFDLESTEDLARLSDTMLTLSPLNGLIILDEIQRRPETFPTLRVLADRHPSQVEFLILGSATLSLLKQSSESLAGRVAYYELQGLTMSEVNESEYDQLWLRGGLPMSYSATSDKRSYLWRRNFVQNFLERDIPQFGISIPSSTLGRFWSMVAHYHAQVCNSAELARAFGISHTTVRRYLDILESTFMLRSLKPWMGNIKKRQVKSPKYYFRDTGMLHYMLGISTRAELERHPKIGASWEGHIIENVIQALEVEDRHCFFWATHTGAELDLVIQTGGELRGIEIKRTSAPSVTPSMRSALSDLNLTQLDMIHAGDKSFALTERIRAVYASRMLEDL